MKFIRKCFTGEYRHDDALYRRANSYIKITIRAGNTCCHAADLTRRRDAFKTPAEAEL